MLFSPACPAVHRAHGEAAAAGELEGRGEGRGEGEGGGEGREGEGGDHFAFPISPLRLPS